MPQAFVVRDGAVVWHGIPMGAGEALDAALPNGAASARGRREAERRRGGAAGEAIRAAGRLAEGGDARGGVAALAKAEAEYPEYAAEVGERGLLSLPDSAWEAWARELATSARARGPPDAVGLRHRVRAGPEGGGASAAGDGDRAGDGRGRLRRPSARAAGFYRDSEDVAGERRAIDRTLALLTTLPAPDAERERAWMARRQAALGKA